MNPIWILIFLSLCCIGLSIYLIYLRYNELEQQDSLRELARSTTLEVVDLREAYDKLYEKFEALNRKTGIAIDQLKMRISSLEKQINKPKKEKKKCIHKKI